MLEKPSKPSCRFDAITSSVSICGLFAVMTKGQDTQPGIARISYYSPPRNS